METRNSQKPRRSWLRCQMNRHMAALQGHTFLECVTLRPRCQENQNQLRITQALSSLNSLLDAQSTTLSPPPSIHYNLHVLSLPGDGPLPLFTRRIRAFHQTSDSLCCRIIVAPQTLNSGILMAEFQAGRTSVGKRRGASKVICWHGNFPGSYHSAFVLFLPTAILSILSHITVNSLTI